ncbi:MAG TPA: molecular chaperone HtpG [Clostridia bacterium]|nr:molecular chaperone HtpG [Clostridia bacterium]
MTVVNEKGSISINTENILPIIKKWLYSDKDIFIRELVSNSADAISKIRRLVEMGEAEGTDEKYEIRIKVDKKKSTLSFIDNGIGMTAEEVKKYINQIAFSGAEDFIEKYKDKAEAKDDIIGHFGLGFYSAFMVADKVEVDTLSYEKGAEPVLWESDGTSGYSIVSGSRTERGTTITLHVMKEEKEFLDFYKVREITEKYCGFMPYEIFVEDVNKKKEKDEEPEKPVNDTAPLWLKKPGDVTDEEYESFYTKTFRDYQKPLFWIHLNMDYPFRLKGILYFPKLKHELESAEGRIKLFYNQVFVADNAKEVIPEFLLLLKGVLDCPDLPLNVSRSFLQNDGYVQKISTHITKKVADKLNKLFKKERDDYNKYWDDINVFVKYGCMRDEKLYDRIKDALIYKTINDEYKTIDEFTGESGDGEKKIYYVSDVKQQAQYIEMFKTNGLDAVILDTMLDSSYISFIESKLEKVKFEGIDSNIAEALAGEGDTDGYEGLVEYFKKVLDDESLKIEARALKSGEFPAVIMSNEQSKRMRDMTRMFGGMDTGMAFPSDDTLVLNTASTVIKKMLKSTDTDDKADAVQHVYELALLAAGKLDSRILGEFIRRSGEMLEKSVEGTVPDKPAE